MALRLAGSASLYMFTRELKFRLIPFGLGHGGGAHSGNEYLIDAAPAVPGLPDIEKAYADFLLHYLVA